MKILLSSYSFAPEIGGIETVSRLLAKRWQEKGHDVTVVTCTKAKSEEIAAYCVVRRPTMLQLLRLQHWADLHFQNNLSLRFLWPSILIRRPLFICHQTWLWHTRSREHPMVRLKLLACRLGSNIAISRPIAAGLGFPAEVIGNPYDESVFFSPDERRVRDFLFVGRLVNDKGVDVFLRALGLLRSQGEAFTATIAGDGPSHAPAVKLAAELGLAPCVDFRGSLRAQALVECYREHRILAVPSRWEEPFGVVALEGFACGCEVVVADAGGLPEAVGRWGHIFPKEDWAALANLLKRLKDCRTRNDGDGVASHLKHHSSETVAERYLQLFQAVVPQHVL